MFEEITLWLRRTEVLSGESVTLGPLWKQFDMFTDGNTKDVAECNFKRDRVTEGFERNSLVSFDGIWTEATECNLKGNNFNVNVCLLLALFIL